MKKIIALCCAICVAMSIGTVFAAEDIYFKSEAAVIVDGQNNAFADKEIVLIVLNQSNEPTEWEDIRGGSDFSSVVYYDTIKCNEKGEYSFSFEPGSSGVYECIVSGGEDSFMLYYTDEKALAAAVDAIEGIKLSEKERALEEIKECIETYHLDFGIYGELYSTADKDSVAELVFDYLEDKGENTSVAVKHGFLAALVNDEKIENIDEYLYALSLRDMNLEKFWQKSEIVTKCINENAPYDSIDEFTTMLVETLTGITIEYNNGTDNIKEIIKLCSDMLGIDKAKITDAFCKSIAGRDDFYDFESLTDYVGGYKAPSQSKPSGGSSGGGGRGSAVSSMSGVTITPTEEEKQEEEQSAGMFLDVPENHWAKEMIEELCVKGVVSGKGGGIFCPEDNVTREEFVKLIVSAMNLNTIGEELAFKDVSQSDWFYKYIYTAYNSKIVKGISEDMFGSGQPITRQDLAVMAYNTINVCDLKTSGKSDNGFVDWNEVADYAKNAVAALKADGILSGDEGGSFRPGDNTTRAEAVKIIYMLMTLK